VIPALRIDGHSAAGGGVFPEVKTEWLTGYSQRILKEKSERASASPGAPSATESTRFRDFGPVGNTRKIEKSRLQQKQRLVPDESPGLG
jgi:hypothetical protein